ncbi:nose resistant to fluoxetine protein 6-like [Sarcoptes scabiei]|nr:nose resistant to fluoxetine protein 6-like [Sarcoptes scabiei]
MDIYRRSNRNQFFSLIRIIFVQQILIQYLVNVLSLESSKTLVSSVNNEQQRRLHLNLTLIYPIINNFRFNLSPSHPLILMNSLLSKTSNVSNIGTLSSSFSSWTSKFVPLKDRTSNLNQSLPRFLSALNHPIGNLPLMSTWPFFISIIELLILNERMRMLLKSRPTLNYLLSNPLNAIINDTSNDLRRISSIVKEPIIELVSPIKSSLKLTTATTLGTLATPSNSSKKKKNGTNLSDIILTRCYEPYGCFKITEPFRTLYRPINLLPESPQAIKVLFYLRTRSNPSTPELIPYSNNSEFFISKYFHRKSDLKFIIHGYLESSDENWINEMSSALLNRGDWNVIAVDWMLGASPPYTQAVANTRLVGSIIAHFIQTIQKTYAENFSVDKIHLIGHSLGAHVAGYTGELLKDLGRITGLDPAEPYFQHTDPIVRLDPTDARFVDVIHSDVASIIAGGFGMSQACGHVDFYPNGGLEQPGCKQTSIKNVLDQINKERNFFDGIRRFIGCNHARSFLIYIEAINSECPFMAFPCHNYEDFIKGKCFAMDSLEIYDYCFAHHHHHHHQQQQEQGQYRSIFLPNSTSNAIACPIRLGLESENDYRVSQEIRKKLEEHLQQPNRNSERIKTHHHHHHHQFEPQSTNSSDQIILSNNRSNSIYYQQHQHLNHHPSKTVYFLQTSEKSPYCQNHYLVRLVFYKQKNRSIDSVDSPFFLNMNTYQYHHHQQQQQQQRKRSRFRPSSSFSSSSTSPTTTSSSSPSLLWPMMEKIQLTVVGTLNRISKEFHLKEIDLLNYTTIRRPSITRQQQQQQKKFLDSLLDNKTSSSTSSTILTTSSSSSSSLTSIEYAVMISGGDLGKLLRIELEWRHNGPNQVLQRSIGLTNSIQTNKTIRKLLAQLSGLETSSASSTTMTTTAALWQNFLQEFSRHFNVNQSNNHHFNHHHQSHNQNQQSQTIPLMNLLRSLPSSLMMNDETQMKFYDQMNLNESISILKQELSKQFVNAYLNRINNTSTNENRADNDHHSHHQNNQQQQKHQTNENVSNYDRLLLRGILLENLETLDKSYFCTDPLVIQNFVKNNNNNYNNLFQNDLILLASDQDNHPSSSKSRTLRDISAASILDSVCGPFSFE